MNNSEILSVTVNTNDLEPIQVLNALSRPAEVPVRGNEMSEVERYIHSEKVIRETVASYKDNVKEILRTKMKYDKKEEAVQTVLENMLTDLNAKEVLHSKYCSESHQVPKFTDIHLLSTCPGDSVHSALIDYFSEQITAQWRIEKTKKTCIAVKINRTDGQCDNHMTAILDKEKELQNWSLETGSEN